MNNAPEPPGLSPATHAAGDVVRLLGLEPLPQEGGFFRRTWPEGRERPQAERAPASVVLVLVTPEQFSALHRLSRPEIWCFHSGDPLDLLQLGPHGSVQRVRLGLAPESGHQLQHVVPAGAWQGARLGAGGRWTLVSCVVVPEFTWDAFTLGQAEALMPAYPDCAPEIVALTRPTVPAAPAPPGRPA